MTIAVIGGSGFHRWEHFEPADSHALDTPYSDEPVRVLSGALGGHRIVFMPRHGDGHTVPPHRVNYRANIWALKELEVSAVAAIATVGGVSAAAVPGALMIPDQVLDYTYGRAHTFFEADDGVVAHADFTEPYCEALRRCLVEAGRRCGVDPVDGGTYAATQGPRFESAAEIRRLERDGADVVGMTGMPEAALARELQLPYAAIAIVVNPAAGTTEGAITMEQVTAWQAAGRSQAEKLLTAGIPAIKAQTFEVPPPLYP